MENKEQSEQINEPTEVKNVSSKEEEKAARKERLRQRRLARRIKRNARIARGRRFKNFIWWLLGVLFLPTVIAATAFIVPLSVITGNDGSIVSQDLSKKSLVDIVRFVAGNSGELGFADFPIVVNSLSDLQKTKIGEKDDGEGNKTPITVGDLIYIDTDKLNTIKFGGDVAGNVSSCIEVIATIESLGGSSALGDFGGLNVFTDEEDAGTIASVDTSAESFEPKEYYYKTNELDTSIEETVYKRAFKDDKTLVDELNGLSAEKKAEIHLYYPPLEKVKLAELKDIIGDSIGRTTISSLLDTLGGGNERLIDIIGADRTIKGIKDFDINEVKLSKVLDLPDDTAEPESDAYKKNRKLYDILRDATGVEGETDAEKNANIKIGDLSGIVTDDIKLSTVLDLPDDTAEPESDAYKKNRKLYDILLDLIQDESVTGYGDITVKNLGGLNTDNLHLSVVLTPPDNTAEPESAEYKQNRKLYDILLDLTKDETVTDYEDITVKNLGGLDTNKLHLNVVLEDNAKNAKLYNILKDLTKNDDAADITVGSLSGLDTKKLHLNTVIDDVDLSDNKVLTALKTKNITVGDIGTALNDLSLYEVYGVDAFKADDGEITSLDKARKFYRVFSEEGSAIYMLETTAVVTSVPAPSELYYHCYDGSTFATDYKTLAELGAVDTVTQYYKCIAKTTHATSFEPASPAPDTEVYSYDENETYYFTANNYYVTTDYAGCGLYKIHEEIEPSVYKDYYIDNRDLLIKSDATPYYVCEESGKDRGYLVAADAAGYFYDDTVIYYLCFDGDDEMGYFTAAYATEQGYTHDATEYYHCFEQYFWTMAGATEKGYTPDTSKVYRAATDHDGNTVYYLDEYQYLDKEAGIWLLLSFDTAEYDLNNTATRRFADERGKAYKYAVDSMTIGNLQKGSSFAKKFKNSTIKQLVDSGLVDDPEFANSEFYKYSLQDLLYYVRDLSAL